MYHLELRTFMDVVNIITYTYTHRPYSVLAQGH